MGNDECVFCNVTKKNKNRILYEDEQIVIFKDINPVAKVHLQCIPKKHINNINELTKDDLQLLNHMYETSRDYLIQNYKELLIENQPIFGFHKPPFYTIKHLHMHCIIPPYTNHLMKVFNCCFMKSFNKLVQELEELE